MKRLTDFLEEIGHETYETGFIDEIGVTRSITKDEFLAREVWKRALGYVEDIKNKDGTGIHRVHLPDPKAQQFIFERREGKNITPQEEKLAGLVDKIEELTKTSLNAVAEDIVADDRDTES